MIAEISTPPAIPPLGLVKRWLSRGLAIRLAAATAVVVMTLIVAFTHLGYLRFGPSPLGDGYRLEYVIGGVPLGYPDDWGALPDLRDRGFQWRLFALIWIGAPSALLVWSLWGAARCFGGLAAGRFFHPATIGGLRSFGLGMLLSLALAPVLGAAGTWIICAIDHHPFSMAIPDTVDSDLLVMIFAGAVALAADALARAAAIARENEQFV